MGMRRLERGEVSLLFMSIFFLLVLEFGGVFFLEFLNFLLVSGFVSLVAVWSLGRGGGFLHFSLFSFTEGL